jgi:hypothetical protein
MGMAASQARYLGLSARKTNVEYEGQQINQERVALANQSAENFNQLLALEVPTVPSKQDFTTVQYSYQDGTLAETVSSMEPNPGDPNYNYLVTHYHFSDIYKGVESRRTNPQVSVATPATDTVTTGQVYNVNGTFYKDYGAQSQTEYKTYDPSDAKQKDLWEKLKAAYPGALGGVGDANARYCIDSDGTYHFTTINDLQTAAPSPGESTNDLQEYTVLPSYVGNSELKLYDPTDVTMKAAYDQIKKDWPDTAFASAPEGDIYHWSGIDGKTYFACLSDLMTSADSGSNPDPLENQDKLIQYNAQTIKEKFERVQKAMVDFDDSGRAQSIRLEDSSAVFTLNTETITDEIAYEDAMNQYTFDVDTYQKQIEDINTKTKIIQEEDRTLELRLRQLDTEQDALQTEMEAVKKVIEKNIESTFKTFE